MTPAEVEAKLRAWLTVQHGPVCPTFTVNGLMIQAADALSAQAVELERMRKALERIAAEPECWGSEPWDQGFDTARERLAELARQALSVKAG